MDPGSIKNDTETGRGRDDGEQAARAIPTAYTRTFGFKRRQYMKGPFAQQILWELNQ